MEERARAGNANQESGAGVAHQERTRSLWKNAERGVIVAALFVCTLAGTFLDTGVGSVVDALLGFVAGTIVLGASAGLAWGATHMLRKAPRRFLVALAAAGAVLTTLKLNPYLSFAWPDLVFYLGLAVFLPAQAILAAGLAVLLGRRSAAISQGLRRTVLGLSGMALLADLFGVLCLVHQGIDPHPTEAPSSAEVAETLDVSNPGEPGDFEVHTLFYGSGNDRRRPEFGADVDIRTAPVDASLLLKDWKGSRARARRWYWGFGIEEAPINGRVWYPGGEGPFPLVLIVHGNHNMEDHSDPGYAYLGELLASHGFITVSVDENFLNGSWSGDFRGKEMPLRAWLLLEHLRVWREWNRTEASPFHRKVDLEAIALLGHSRGGEAVSIAAAFNHLPCFPDDARVRFDYGFSIKSLVAIAQIDRRYERRIELQDVNFLALHGSYDSDEPSFHGMRQYARLRFTGNGYFFKAGLWIHRANHGQFNTAWGRFDAGPPGSWLLNVAPLISGEDQRRLAKLYISAFLEATLRGRADYLPLFRDHRVIAPWLPRASYVSRFQDSLFRAVADFEEDMDLTTASANGGVMDGRNLVIWREQDVPFRDKSTQRNNAVYLGWNYGEALPSEEEKLASYSILLPESLDGTAALSSRALLTFSLAEADEKATPPGEEAQDSKDETADRSDPARPPLDLSLELVDSGGTVSRIPMSQFASIPQPHRVQVLKWARLNRKEYGPDWEPTLQTYEIPLSSFLNVGPRLDLSTLRTIRFRFDQCPKGVILLDDVGFRDSFGSSKMVDVKEQSPKPPNAGGRWGR